LRCLPLSSSFNFLFPRPSPTPVLPETPKKITGPWLTPPSHLALPPIMVFYRFSWTTVSHRGLKLVASPTFLDIADMVSPRPSFYFGRICILNPRLPFAWFCNTVLSFTSPKVSVCLLPSYCLGYRRGFFCPLVVGNRPLFLPCDPSTSGTVLLVDAVHNFEKFFLSVYFPLQTASLIDLAGSHPCPSHTLSRPPPQPPCRSRLVEYMLFPLCLWSQVFFDFILVFRAASLPTALGVKGFYFKVFLFPTTLSNCIVYMEKRSPPVKTPL